MSVLQDAFIKSLMKIARRGTKKTTLPVLIYHRVLSSPDCYRPSEPTVEQFWEQMRFVRNNFEVLELSEAAAQLRDACLAKDAIVITFDDGYRDNLQNAAKVLADSGMVATFFIATGYLNNGRMWNDTVIDGFKLTSKKHVDLNSLGLGSFKIDNDASRLGAARTVIDSIKYTQAEKRTELAERIALELEVEFEDDYMLADDEVVQLDRMGMEIGAHTVTHPILLLESEQNTVSELQGSKQYLERLLEKKVNSFAYPNGRYGKDYDERTARLVAGAGFHCAVSTEAGVSSVGDDIFQIKRFTPWSKDMLKYSLQLFRNQFL